MSNVVNLLTASHRTNLQLMQSPSYVVNEWIRLEHRRGDFLSWQKHLLRGLSKAERECHYIRMSHGTLS